MLVSLWSGFNAGCLQQNGMQRNCDAEYWEERKCTKSGLPRIAYIHNYSNQLTDFISH